MPFMAVYLEAMDRLAGFSSNVSSNVSINDIAPSPPLIVGADGELELAACRKAALSACRMLLRASSAALRRA